MLAGGSLEEAAGVAAVLFLFELADKDAMLLLALSTRTRALTVFAAGAVAFVLTTTVNVIVGSLLAGHLPITLLRVAGGSSMIALGLWQALHPRAAPEGRELAFRAAGWLAFLAMVGSLALLDLAGDATEILTIVFTAQYGAVLVFPAACAGLIAAAAAETAVGNILGRLLSPRAIGYFSTAMILLVGALTIALAVV